MANDLQRDALEGLDFLWATATAPATAVATGAAIANATATASTAEFYGPGLLHMTLKGNASMICSKPQRC